MPAGSVTAMPETVTITDNRTGESVEIPIIDGGVDSEQWRKLLPGVWFYDPAFLDLFNGRSGVQRHWRRGLGGAGRISIGVHVFSPL